MTPPALPHVRFHLPAPMPVGPGLARGWRFTAFEAAGAVARLGRRSRGTDRLLMAAGVREGAFVGAWNPLSRRRPEAWNTAMLDRLRGLVRRAGVPCHEGTGSARRPRWAEEHLLVCADLRRCAAFARRFRQHAVVVVRLRAPARLRVLR